MSYPRVVLKSYRSLARSARANRDVWMNAARIWKLRGDVYSVRCAVASARLQQHIALRLERADRAGRHIALYLDRAEPADR